MGGDSQKIAVGLDPSLSGFGVCVLIGDTILTERFVSDSLGDTMHERMLRYKLLVNQVIKSMMRHGQPSIVLIEGYSFGSPNRAVQLAELGGLLRRRLGVHQVTAAEVAPQSLKKFATDKGSGKKLPAVPTHLTKRYGVMFDSDDEYDAFALAKIGQCVIGYREPQTKPQAEVVEAVRVKWQAELEAREAREVVA